MRTLGTLIVMFALFAAGLWLMYSNFQGLVSNPTQLGLQLLSFAAGLICLLVGLICGVLLLKPAYRT